MAYNVIVTKETVRDIEKTVSHIAYELKNAPAAKNFLDSLENSLRRLSRTPSAYSRCTDEQLYRDDYRKILIDDCTLIYRVDEVKKAVSIVSAAAGGGNYGKLL